MSADRHPVFRGLPTWRPRSRLLPRNIPVGLPAWLFDPGSLTQRLRCTCAGRFRVRVLAQARTRPSRDEASALGLRWGAWVWSREVHLLCNGQPWVFARTLIPVRTLQGRGRRLTLLGTKPLGAVLFADRGVQRGPMEIARIVAGQDLHRRAFAGFTEPPKVIWGRRSIFFIDGNPLLVMEIFLPNLQIASS